MSPTGTAPTSNASARPAREKAAGALRRVSILARLLGAFTVLAVFPPLLVGGTAILAITGESTDRVVSYSGQLAAQVAKRIEEILQRCLVLSENVIVYGPVQRGLAAPPPDELDRRALLRDLDRELGPFIYRFSNVHGIGLYAQDGSVFYETGYEQFAEGSLNLLRLQAAASPINARWAPLRTLRGTNCVALGREVNSAEGGGRKLGFLVFLLNERTFARDSYRDVDLGPGADFLVLDAAGTVVSASDPLVARGARHPDEALLAALAAAGEVGEGGAAGHFRVGKGKEERLVLHAPVADTDWRVAARVPWSLVAAASRRVAAVVALTAALAVLASVTLAALIYRGIRDPVNRLAAAARAISSGRFDVRVDDGYPDEIGTVGRAVDEMCERLDGLMAEVKAEQERKRVAELRMLQAQIKPHFLFNALDSIRWTAELSGNETVAEGVGALSGLLRASIVDTEDTVPLSAELENVRNYAYVQKLRYGDSFQLEYDAEPGTESCPVPKLLLQPLVENSIIHGVADDADAKVRIRLEARREGESLVVTVTDDGPGFREKKSGGFSGIGVKNVRERIRLRYGVAWGLAYERRDGLTRAVVRIPFTSEAGADGKAGEAAP